MARGRPTKLTPEFLEEFIRLLRLTRFIETAADLAGIDRQSVYDWIKRGRKRPRTIYGKFSCAVKKAQVEKEVLAITRIEDFGAETWQADAWYLERRHPERWASNRSEVAAFKRELAELRESLDGLKSRFAAAPADGPGPANGRMAAPTPPPGD